MTPSPEPNQAPLSVREGLRSADPEASNRRDEDPDEHGPRIALVDGSNVAHAGEAQARLANINLVCDKLEEEGLKPIVVADAALRHQIDDTAAYERMIDRGVVRAAPAGTDADYFLLAFARELDASVVSNDRFKDRQEAFPEARDRVIRYMIVEGEVVLERRTRRRD